MGCGASSTLNVTDGHRPDARPVQRERSPQAVSTPPHFAPAAAELLTPAPAAAPAPASPLSDLAAVTDGASAGIDVGLPGFQVGGEGFSPSSPHSPHTPPSAGRSAAYEPTTWPSTASAPAADGLVRPVTPLASSTLASSNASPAATLAPAAEPTATPSRPSTAPPVECELVLRSATANSLALHLVGTGGGAPPPAAPAAADGPYAFQLQVEDAKSSWREVSAGRTAAVEVSGLQPGRAYRLRLRAQLAREQELLPRFLSPKCGASEWCEWRFA